MDSWMFVLNTALDSIAIIYCCYTMVLHVAVECLELSPQVLQAPCRGLLSGVIYNIVLARLFLTLFQSATSASKSIMPLSSTMMVTLDIPASKYLCTSHVMWCLPHTS